MTAGKKDGEPEIIGDLAAALQEAFEQRGQGSYVLRLYIAGSNPRSAVALANLKRICAQYLSGRFDLEVIDIYQHPEQLKDGQIVAAPTLVKVLPNPLRRFVGDLSDVEKILVGLDLKRPSEG